MKKYNLTKDLDNGILFVFDETLIHEKRPEFLIAKVSDVNTTNQESEAFKMVDELFEIQGKIGELTFTQLVDLYNSTFNNHLFDDVK